MTYHVSTGLRNKLLDTAPLKTILNLGFINIYGGTVPATADDAIGSATLLCVVSNNSTGTGLTMASAASAGTLPKNSGEVWSGVNVATATATFYRHVAVGDTGASSSTEARVQGSVGTVGAEMNLSSVNLTNGATQTIDYYSIALPTL
jgi:hypothetical protein